jgi:methionyl-tRNA formyltransferase
MKIAYIGTPALSAGLLKKLIDNRKELGIEIDIVITQPDMPVGRKQILTPSPVKELALQNNLAISHDITVLNDKNVELALLFAFGVIIPQKVLDLPTYGFWNVHPSMLPAYRGASPITFPIFLGEKTSGVSLMQMDADLDHGPIISQNPFEISKNSLRGTIEDGVIEISYNMISQAIKKLTNDKIVNVVQQNHDRATFTRPLFKQDGFIERGIVLKAIKGEAISQKELPMLIQEFYTTNKLAFSGSTFDAGEVIWNMHRALYGWPGIWTTFMHDETEKRLKLIDVSFEGNKFILNSVQVEGKNVVDWATFNKAYSLV